ncbi:pseudouridine synthase [Gimesia sp.]|uniref:pseudouridine synthase n=1 Tax=Gimesia sp. TaxID=2024833 RepID=UPI0025BBA9BC|nr:pseudouridine synthase [Gimesia sp.]|tara:strand:- start:220 stop:1374 length:1155 start_codon:yes stop_codon:yes gene_type:complete
MSSDSDPQTPSEETSAEDDSHLIRLQKFLAATGLGSRRHCEEYIETGRVTIDGDVVTELGAKVDPETQVIEVDGERVRLQPRRYYLLNKPSGFLCTNNDPAGRRRVVDLFPNDGQRLFTVGRLDENSEGLILVTNDGELAQRLAHPRYRVARTYHVQVVGNPPREKLDELRKGVRFKEGVFRVSGLKYLKKQGKSAFLELTLHEGQNREIRRMMARIGHKVIQLVRIRFGPLNLGKLKTGESRRLSDTELKKLRQLLNEKHSPDIRHRKGQKNAAPVKGRASRKTAVKRSGERGAAAGKYISETTPGGKKTGGKKTDVKKTGVKKTGVKKTGEKRTGSVQKKAGGKRTVSTGRKPAADSTKPKTTGRRIIGDDSEKRTRQGKRK